MRWCNTGRLLYLWLVFFALGYLVQALSPLRVNTDVYRLLSMAVSAFKGQGYLVDGFVDQFPVGYPFLVRTLMDLGIANSTTLVLLNIIFLAIGLIIFYIIIRDNADSINPLLPIVFTLSSWVMVKHITLPISDIVYFGLSIICIFFGQRFAKTHKYRYLLGAIFFAIVSLQVRTVGIVLFPAVFYAAGAHRVHTSAKVGSWFNPEGLFFFAVCIVGLMALIILSLGDTEWFVVQFLSPGSYFQAMLEAYASKATLENITQMFLRRLIEFGEIFCNFPGNKFPHLKTLHIIGGFFAWWAVLKGMVVCYNKFPDFRLPVVYFALFSMLLFIWPYYDPRFWLPVLPFLCVFFLVGIKVFLKNTLLSRNSIGFLGLFILFTGLASLGYSTRISLSGRNIGEVFGDGSSRMTYRFAFQSEKPIDFDEVSEQQFSLLLEFEPLAVAHRIHLQNNIK